MIPAIGQRWVYQPNVGGQPSMICQIIARGDFCLMKVVWKKDFSGRILNEEFRSTELASSGYQIFNRWKFLPNQNSI